ncbi:MAG: glutamyl-tRNA reductase [Chloroflexi bacterium]|nr:MAG: glutamyl-tRNA reductase [Chloroflexota bacterium]
MQLICLSVSHHNTPVELRECLSLPIETLEEGLSQFPVRADRFAPISEMVILSTCNRLEIYAVIVSPEIEAGRLEQIYRPILDYLRQVFEIPTGRAEPYFRRFSGAQAVRHLYLVAAGLDSIAIGESQILGQVSRSLDTALRIGSARHVLSSLFRAAIHTGKRVRTETDLGRRPISISTVAVQLAEESIGRLADRSVLVIGAGKMGGNTVEALQACGARQIVITSRTFAHAAEMAGQFGATPKPFDHLFEALLDADVVFTSSAAPLPIIHRDTIRKVMAQRPERPLALVDLAVPRNVETRIRELANVRVFDMDDLQSFAKDAIASDTGADDVRAGIARAESIVEEEVREYEKLLRIIPFLGELHKKVEAIRQREVEKTLRHLPDLDPEVAALFGSQIEVLSRSLVQKILHEPTMHLRSESNEETLNDYVDALARLFDLCESETTLPLQKGKQ